MFIIQSHAGTRSNSTFKLFSSRRFFCAAITTLLFAAFALVMLARPQQANAPTKKNTTKHSDEEHGRKTFESVCATCPGLDSKVAERGPNVATRAEVQRLSDEETLRILRAGIPAAGIHAVCALGFSQSKDVMCCFCSLLGVGD